MAGRHLLSRLGPHASRTGTGLVGLLRVAEPVPVLKTLYAETLAVVKTMPEVAKYRRNVEALTRDRLRVVEQAKSVDEIEEQIGQGQAEQLIAAAEEELSLAKQMVEWQPWGKSATTTNADQWKWP